MEKRNATIGELASLLSGKRGLEVYETGALDRGLVACGQVVGLVHDIPTVKELIDRVIKEAEEVISRIAARGTFKPLRKPSDVAKQ
jgi:NAD(P)H-dependent flavin oxidoreductase YrpB (nitropropane dioxygenase family)